MPKLSFIQVWAQLRSVIRSPHHWCASSWDTMPIAGKSGSFFASTMMLCVIAVAEVLSAPPPDGTDTWSYFCQG